MTRTKGEGRKARFCEAGLKFSNGAGASNQSNDLSALTSRPKVEILSLNFAAFLYPLNIKPVSCKPVIYISNLSFSLNIFIVQPSFSCFIFQLLAMAEEQKQPKRSIAPSKTEAVSGGNPRFPNPPDSFNPDPATLRDQWRYAVRQYSRWYSQAWGTAILAGASFFALGWLIKGYNPLPSRARDGDEASGNKEDGN